MATAPGSFLFRGILAFLSALIAGTEHQRRPETLLAVAAAGQARFIISRLPAPVFEKAPFCGSAAVLMLPRRHHR